jgi:hypothetical protein
VRSIFVGSLQRGAAIHIAGIDVCVGTDYCKAIPGDWRRLDQANELRAWGCLTRCVAGRAVAERGNLSKTGRRIALTILKRASRPCRVVVGCSEAAMGFEQAAGCRLQLQTVRVRVPLGCILLAAAASDAVGGSCVRAARQPLAASKMDAIEHVDVRNQESKASKTWAVSATSAGGVWLPCCVWLHRVRVRVRARVKVSGREGLPS